MLTLHDDASGSISASIERNLLHIATDTENLVDRFDVRLLLDEVPQAPSARCAELQIYSHHRIRLLHSEISYTAHHAKRSISGVFVSGAKPG